MSNLLQNNSMLDWYEKPLGQELAILEQEQIQHIWPELHGQFCVQLGEYTQSQELQSPLITHHIIVSSQPQTKNQLSPIISHYTHLPFPSDSIDIVFLPHTLEFEPEINSVLNEAWRILSPKGQLIILGLNPWSLWGLWKLLGPSESTPWNGRFQSPEKIRRLLKQMNAAIILSKSFFFRPPIEKEKFLTRSRWLEKILRLLMPSNAGAYLLVAKKNVIPLTPLKTRWNWQTVMANNKGFAPTTHKVKHD